NLEIRHQLDLCLLSAHRFSSSVRVGAHRADQNAGPSSPGTDPTTHPARATARPAAGRASRARAVERTPDLHHAGPEGASTPGAVRAGLAPRSRRSAGARRGGRRRSKKEWIPPARRESLQAPRRHTRTNIYLTRYIYRRAPARLFLEPAVAR